MQIMIGLPLRLVNGLLVLNLAFMVALTFVDVLGRRLFNTPVFGANDLTEHLMAIIIFSGLPVLTARRAHLSVDLFDRWLMKESWSAWHKAVDLLIFMVLALIAYQYFVSIEEAKLIDDVSPALGIPRFWMYGYISIMSLIAAILALFVSNPASYELSAEGDS
jgi:TRAP-type C4-dicarboxylate transport system permease small subunit